MLNIISGYLGLFKQPIDSKYVSTMYGITDNTKDKLILILLSPSSFIDAYKISKHITYTEIYFVVPALDVLFISDIFNLFMKIKNIKPSAKWIFPKVPQIPTSVEFELGQIVTNHFVYDGYIDYNFNISVEFILSDGESRPFYDIILNDGNKTIYFSQYNTQEKIELLYNNLTIDEIHIPYNSTIYGGLNYNQLVALDNKYHNKLKVHSFLSIEEYLFCKQINLSRMGEVKYNDFI